ncbi:MAG: sugar phosphate isomerase/epimerase [Pirellulales bacterium]|nr:sugar phosphate isomerase/epimerase [Pirellulales bacterium]
MTNQTMTLSRRTFLGGAAAVAASSMIRGAASAAPAGGPESNFNGVQIGVITYSYRSLPGSAEEILKYVIQSGISSIELMGEPAEQFAGAPGAGKGDRRALLDWRLSVPMDRFKALRKMFNEAGVNIHIVKFGDIGNPGMPDAQIEYYFEVAKALGATGITREISEEAARKLGPIADKHEIMIGFHNHTQLTPTTYDGEILSHGKYLGINFDIGHYVAGTNHSPIPLIEKHRERILSLHLKDRKVNNGPNLPFGEGDTPVALVLQYMKRNKLAFPADIELEYKVPEGSGAVREVARCVEFCKQALA